MLALTNARWVPCSAKDHPEIDLTFDLAQPEAPGNENIEIGGLMLCKMPAEIAEQRNAYYNNMTHKLSL